MECPNCGQENRDVALFCQHCGTPLVIADSSAAEPANTPEPAAERPPEETAAASEHTEPSFDEPVLDGATLEIEPEPERTGDEPPPAPDPEPAPLAETEPEMGAWEQALSPADDALPPQAPVTETDAEETTVELVEEALDLAAGQEPTDALPVESQPAEAAPPEDELPLTSDDVPEPIEGLEPVPEAVAAEQEFETILPAQPLVDPQALADAHQIPWSDESAPLEALELGTILNGRYKVIEVLEQTAAQIHYRVRDLARCPRCGAAGHSPEEAFCTACGALMDYKPVAEMIQQPAALEGQPVEIESEDQFVEEGQNYWVWTDRPPPVVTPEEQPLMRLLVGLQSDTGQVRELDEDSMFALTMAFTYESVTHQLGLFVVADGMGGHEGGEIASQLAIQTAAKLLLTDLFSPEMAGTPLSDTEILDRIGNAIRRANDEVYLERQKRDIDMGTTITAAFVKDWVLHLGHVGDCRAYLWGEEGLLQLTTDHSIVAGMVAAGTIQPEEIYTHPQRSVIYRCIGDQPTVEVDLGTMQLSAGERLLVCCDGLWEMLRQSGIEDILLAEADPQTACDQMVHQANLAGGTDNISVIIVQL